MILVRAAVQCLSQICLEQILYTFSVNRTANMLTTISYLIVNTLVFAWQIIIANGTTLYGFKLRNSANFHLSQLFKFSKDSFLLSYSLLWRGALKFISDLTSPLCVIISQYYIAKSYVDPIEKFYAQNDFFIYSYVYSLPKIIPDAFLSVSILLDAIMNSKKEYAL